MIKEIYSLLLDLQSLSLSIIRSHWENDLAYNITDDLWESILRHVHSSSVCARHGLLQFKVLHRLHISEEKLAKFHTNADPLCNRCKVDIGSLLHTFWSCPKLQTYWISIFETLSKAYNIQLAPAALTALFGVIPPGVSVSKAVRDAIAFASLIARRLVLLRWKDEAPPTHDQWIAEVMKFVHLEKIRGTLSGSTAKFLRSWQLFLTHMKP